MPEFPDILTLPREEPIRLWAEVFGDPPALPAHFLARLPEIGFGLAAVEQGRLLGAAYGIDALEIEGARCAYLYAVAVYPEARGRGLGAKLSRAVFETAAARGAVYRCTEPAEPSLFAWYGKILALRPVLYRQETLLEAGPLLPLRPIDAAAYGARREQLLENAPHLRCGEAALAYEAHNCACFGGAFFAVGEGIAAASIDEGIALIRESLGPEPERQAAAVAAALGCEKARLLRCADEGTPFLAGDRPFPSGTVWNLAFD